MIPERMRILLGSLLLAAVLFLMIYLAAGYKFALLPFEQSPKKLTNITYQTQASFGNIYLPAKLKNLPPHTTVTLYTDVQVSAQESLLVKSVFAPMRVYFDDVIMFESGQNGSYPSYMNDPPTMLSIVAIPNKDAVTVQKLRIEYLSPTQRNELSLPTLYVGNEATLIAKLFHDDGFSLIFSAMLMILGALLVLVFVIFLKDLPNGSSFLWIGLFALAAGVWVFGECDLAALLLPYPSVLYVMTYLGLFLTTAPFLQFGLVILNLKNRLPLTIMLYVHIVSIAGAILLQLLGVMDFTKSLYWFHIIAPLGFIVFAANLLWEYFRHKNPVAKRFAPAVILLATSTMLEVLNYWLHLINDFTIFFQIGILVFILFLAIVSGYYVRQSMRLMVDKLQLEYEVGAMGRQLALQHSQYERLTQNAETVKSMHHDMRHHLTVIRSLTDLGNVGDIKEYIGNLENNLVVTQERTFCKNQAVNAVVTHYFCLAEKEGIAVEARLDIPEGTGTVPAMDLCVIMGNYLENAVEACCRLEYKNGFIRVRSRIEEDTLSIVVINSFDGLWFEKNGTYFSRKESDNMLKLKREGVGISSVAAVCKKHRGLAQYEIVGNVWKSSALVHMKAATINK